MAEERNPRLSRLRRALHERGSQLAPDIRWLARAVVEAPDEALSHEECFDYLPECADAETEGENIAEKYPLVKQHLDLCEECSEQYAKLLDLIRAERAGEIPVPFSDFVKQKATEILTVIARTELPDLSSIIGPFFQKVDSLSAGSVSLGSTFAFSRGTAQALGLGAGDLTTPVATLTLTYAATGKLVESLTPDQVEKLSEQNNLGKRAEEQALVAALELNVKPALAKSIAKEFAALIAADPQSLRVLIEREKH